MELSKVLNAGSSANDKAKPHLKLTAIEHMLKSEIESCIGDSLDRNADLSIVDIEESVSAKKKSRMAADREDDQADYWSDFSDDDYTEEANEEKKASEVLLSLQRWVYNSNLEDELSEKYPNRVVITLDELKATLSDAGYYCELLDLQSLLKRLDISDDKGVDYKQLLNNLAEKNAAWWKGKLSNNGFDITSKGKRDGNFRPLCNKAVYQFIINNLGEKTKQAINRAGYLSINECIDELYEDYHGGLSKANLRKELLDKKIPLTRLDTHILHKTLEDSENGNVKSKDLKRFAENSQEYMLAKNRQKGSKSNIWVEEETEFGKDRTSPSKEANKLKEDMARLESQIKEKNKSIIQLNKEVHYFKEIAATSQQPSASYSQEINSLEKENRDLNRKMRDTEDKFIRDKKRMEDLIKENISTPQAGDFILLQKKIELMEHSMYEREKDIQKQSMSTGFNSKDKQELKQLREQIEAERAHYSKIIDKKNQEIKIFREELDIMLQELDEVKTQNLEKERMFMQQKSSLISN